LKSEIIVIFTGNLLLLFISLVLSSTIYFPSHPSGTLIYLR